MGKILNVAEWLFEQNDSELAIKMQKHTAEIEPNNLLFEWAYLFTIGENNRAKQLALEIILRQNTYINWLKNTGYPGEYIYVSLLYSAQME